MTKIFLITAVLITATGRVFPLPASGGGPGQAQPSDSTGIEGFVYSVSGNRMPSPSLKPGPHPRTGIRSTIWIFMLTNTGQVTRQGQSAYYTAVNTQLVRQADTDEKGHFAVLLPPGHYSVFTKKGDLFYASRMDEKNNISPVQVLPGKMTKLECRVESDHKPVY